MNNRSAFDHPFDTSLSSGLRFLAEIIAWVACAWAAARESIWLAIPVLVILIGLPSVFSTPGDKKQITVATPGPLRVLLEFALYIVAVAFVFTVSSSQRALQFMEQNLTSLTIAPAHQPDLL